MDAHLKTLADAGLAVEAAEEAIAEGAHGQARDELDLAEAHLAGLREAWGTMSTAERAMVGTMAKPLAARVATAAAAIPKRSELSVGTPEVDPDEEIEPGAAPVVVDRRAEPPGPAA